MRLSCNLTLICADYLCGKGTRSNRLKEMRVCKEKRVRKVWVRKGNVSPEASLTGEEQQAVGQAG